jgi:hypothetical protein
MLTDAQCKNAKFPLMQSGRDSVMLGACIWKSAPLVQNAGFTNTVKI